MMGKNDRYVNLSDEDKERVDSLVYPMIAYPMIAYPMMFVIFGLIGWAMFYVGTSDTPREAMYHGMWLSLVIVGVFAVMNLARFILVRTMKFGDDE